MSQSAYHKNAYRRGALAGCAHDKSCPEEEATMRTASLRTAGLIVLAGSLAVILGSFAPMPWLAPSTSPAMTLSIVPTELTHAAGTLPIAPHVEPF
jgi:hypothetical protein